MSQTILDSSSFVLDPRLVETTWTLSDWPLCRVLLKNHAVYPWLILVPRKLNLTEVTELSSSESMQLMQEVCRLSEEVQAFFKPDKLNLGALGNVVSQFHFHVIGRFKSDPLWPEAIWQSRMEECVYDDPRPLIRALSRALIW